MASGGYQDISALLKSLTAYPSAHAQAPPQEREQSPTRQLRPQAVSFHVKGDQINNAAEGQGQHDSHVEAQRYIAIPDAQSISYSFQFTPDAPDFQPPPQRTKTTRKMSAVAGDSKPVQDMRTITTWPAALRLVTKLLAQNPTMSENIKKMIANQVQNEQTWWAGRQELLRQQGARKDGQKELNDVLRSVGATPSSGPELMDPIAELKRYDTKVYSAATKMVETMRSDFESMHVPFFGLKAELIAEPVIARKQGDHHEDGSKASSADGKIDKDELIRLQRKMIAFLEEYCKD